MPSSNTLITPTVIAKEALMQLRNNLVMANQVHRDYKNEFVKKIGDTVTIRKPVKFTVTDGASRSGQNVTESSTTFQINKRKHVSWDFSTAVLTHTIEDYSKRYITPACIALANQIDSDLCDLYKDVFWYAGAAGTTPATFAAFGDVATALDLAACPSDQRRMVFDPKANWTMADAMKGTFEAKMASDSIRKGYLGHLAGFDCMMDQNIKYHTQGTATGTPQVDGASQTGSTLNTEGWTASVTGILAQGDIFTIADVYSVNPISKESTRVLQPFTVTAAATSNASGDAALSISPAITTSGAYQTVSAGPANDALITLIGSHKANLAFHKNAFGLVFIPLEMPDGAAFKARETQENISVRVIKDYDIDNDVDIIRLDVFYGVKTLYPELAARLLG